MKSFSRFILVFTLVVWSLNTCLAQNSPKEDKAGKAAEITSLINNKDFVFKAMPADTSKSSRPLDRQLFVAISNDTLVVSLPVQAKNDSVKFNCTGFGYNAIQNKKGGWDITITPRTGMSDVRQLTLAVTPTGHASLNVVRGHGSPLSFDGYIKQEDY